MAVVSTYPVAARAVGDFSLGVTGGGLVKRFPDGGFNAGMSNGTLLISAASNALTIALKTAAGTDPSSTDPVSFYFHNLAGTVGGFTVRTVTAALSLVVSSGSTLGVTSAKAFRIWIVAFDDAGTIRLGVVQCCDRTAGAEKVTPLPESFASSTAEGGAGAADTAGVIYTGTAVSNKPILILGYAEWSALGLTTAGTWTTTNWNITQLFGPGIHLPGHRIQETSAVSTPNTSNATTTYAISAQQLAIVLTSAASLIRAMATCYLQTPGSTGQGCSVRFSRGATANTNLIGSESQLVTNGASIIAPALLVAYDTPNVVASQAYNVQVKALTGGTAFLGGAIPSMTQLTEIQT
jgi:hypothetical protein